MSAQLLQLCISSTQLLRQAIRLQATKHLHTPQACPILLAEQRDRLGGPFSTCRISMFPVCASGYRQVGLYAIADYLLRELLDVCLQRGCRAAEDALLHSSRPERPPLPGQARLRRQGSRLMWVSITAAFLYFCRHRISL